MSDEKETHPAIDADTGVIQTPSTGEGVVHLDEAKASAAAAVERKAAADRTVEPTVHVDTGVVQTASTGEGVVQLEGERAAAAAAIAAKPPAPGPNAPPANDSTIDRSTVHHQVDESAINGRRVAGRDTGQGPTHAGWTPEKVLEEIRAEPRVAAAIVSRLEDDAHAGESATGRSTALQFVEVLGAAAARQLATGMLRELDRLDVPQILEDGHASGTRSSSPAEPSGSSSPVPDQGASSVGGASSSSSSTT